MGFDWGDLNVYTSGLWEDQFKAYTGQSAAENQARANQISQDNAARNIEMQKEFAKMGVQWKVADARAAGISPLAALGASTASFSPVSIGMDTTDHAGAGMRNMGQDLQRVLSSTQNADQRQMTQLQIQGAQLDVQGKAIDNQIKNSQLQKMQATGPAFPGSANFISGQGDTRGKIIEKPLERTASLPGSPQAEPGAIPDIGWAKTSTGVVPIPSSDVKQRIEDNMPHEFSHFARNNIAPAFGGGTKPPASALPKGATDWRWNTLKMEYQPHYPRKKQGWHKWDTHNLD